MKILYSDHRKPLTDYGILVPLDPNRARNTRDFLLSNDGVPGYEDIICSPSIAPATPEALALAHTEEFLSDLAGPEVDTRVVEAFELLDQEGRPNRYDPDAATRPHRELYECELETVALTHEAMKVALAEGFCYFLGGGWHHSMSFGGRGFCLLNDIVIGIRLLQRAGLIKTAWVIDTDAHKGDGTAELTIDDSTILTLSIHMADGWPLDESAMDSQGRLLPWYYPSTVDIPVPEGGEAHYLALLEHGLTHLKLLSVQKPDLVVVVNGSDPWKEDALPSSDKLQLSLQQVQQRDQLVYNFLRAEGLPQCWLMSGGYGAAVWRVHAEFLRWLLLHGGVKS